MADVASTYRRLAPRALIYGLLSGAATALLIGIPTAVIPNSHFMRMTPVRAQDYVFLALTALLAALLGASYALPATCSLQEGKLTAGGFLSFLAVGCPVCNKLVVLLVGAGGALSYFQPLQPIIGILSLALLGYALWSRLRGIRKQRGPVATLSPIADPN